jgi:hypothetical protein
LDSEPAFFQRVAVRVDIRIAWIFGLRAIAWGTFETGAFLEWLDFLPGETKIVTIA